MGNPGTVTILVTDLVGSTELRVAIGEDTADRLRRAHDRLLSELVLEHGGKVVKGMGDGIIATFAGAAGAVSAAVAMQQAVAVADRNSDRRAAVRIGISAGDVTWDDGDCFGTPVVEAARLCACAEGGQILVADVVRILARGRHGHELTPLGAMELKGLPEAVVTHEVNWAPVSDPNVPARAPLHPVLRADREFPFAGRDRELEVLANLLHLAQGGDRAVALVAGEPGIGKTRLAAQISTAAYDGGALVLYGRCDDDMGIPYQPFVDALQYFLDTFDGDDLVSRLGPHGGDLARLLPDLPSRVPGLPPPLRSEPDAERQRLFDAVTGWLRTIADVQPVVMVVDDVQSAASPTLALLRHIIRGTERSRVMVVVTYRDTELGRTHPLAEALAELRRVPGVERLSLTGLSPDDLALLLEDTTASELTNAVYAETEGNPFFAREVLRSLQESGALKRSEGNWVAERPILEIGVPEGVREVVGRRLAHLSPGANQALSLAAVIGIQFTLDVLANVGSTSEDDLVDALDESITARLLVEHGVGTYRFSHALVRSTLYEELSLTSRVRLHRRVGDAIETLTPGDVRSLAHHFAIAAAGGQDSARAAHYAIGAARLALNSLAADDAKSLANNALDLLEGVDDDVACCDALTCLGEAERLLGEPDHREHLIAAGRLAQTLGDVDRLVAATMANGGGIADVVGADLERIELFEAALAAIGPADSVARARLLALLSFELTSSARAGDKNCFAVAEDALATARRVGDPATLAVVLHGYAQAAHAPSTLAQRRVVAREGIALAEELHDPVSLGWALLDQGFAEGEAGNPSALFDAAAESARVAREYGLGTFTRPDALAAAARALMEGRLADGDSLAEDAYRIVSETGHPSALVLYMALLIEIRREQARSAELLPLVSQMFAGQPAMTRFQPVLCRIQSDLGHADEARALLSVIADDEFALIAYDEYWLTLMCMCAEVCATLGDRRLAGPLLEHISPFGDQYVMSFVALGAAGRFIGALEATLGRYEDADRSFSTAAHMEQTAGAVIHLARTRVEWARMLLARRGPGDADRATALLDEVLTATSWLELPAVEQRARELSP